MREDSQYRSASALATPHVRRALLHDADEIARLALVLGYPVDSSVVLARLERIARMPSHAVIVADEADRLLGWAAVEQRLSIAEGEQAEVVSLVVDPECRWRGVGRALLRAAEEWAMLRGLPLMRVRSNILREDSHVFYHRLGYVRSKTQHVYAKPMRSIKDV